jgi:hypothetical protein
LGLKRLEERTLRRKLGLKSNPGAACYKSFTQKIH